MVQFEVYFASCFDGFVVNNAIAVHYYERRTCLHMIQNILTNFDQLFLKDSLFLLLKNLVG